MMTLQLNNTYPSEQTIPTLHKPDVMTFVDMSDYAYDYDKARTIQDWLEVHEKQLVNVAVINKFASFRRGEQ